MNNNRIRNLTVSAVVAAIYVILTLGIAPISYGPIQFRVSEILNLLAFFNLIVTELFNMAALQANNMVVMPAFV